MLPLILPGSMPLVDHEAAAAVKLACVKTEAATSGVA
jgi:hypothetical protein